MAIFSHNVFENVRTRIIVTYSGNLLLLEPAFPEAGWQLPGGGLEKNESLAECGEREVYEETGLRVQVTGVAFLREFVVPKYCVVPEGGEGVGFGLEVYLYARLVSERTEPRREHSNAQMPHWVAFADVPGRPVWPKELKTLAAALAAGHAPRGVPSFVTPLESPWAEAPQVEFA